ncbi:MAG: PIG-L family deacetylase [Acidimicrobiia bacterium]|nr:MAG: PIG-L family deacetylase [Acidimicrobiia bacterium]
MVCRGIGTKYASGMTTNLYNDVHDSDSPLERPGRVLTIGAHPDDAEFGAGATLARWADAGTEVTMLIVTDGSKGSWDPDQIKDSLIAQRKREQRAAADVLRAHHCEHLGYVDGELEYSMELRRAIALAVRRARPDVVLSHDPWQRYQLHPDHRAAGTAAVDGVIAAREPLAYREAGLPAHRPSTILLWSADAPDHAEPVDPPWGDRKIEALLCHSSQGLTTMGDPEQSGAQRTAFIERIEAWHTRNGERLGIGPAEVFKRLAP